MIKSMMNEGKIVPSEVTVKLLQKAMEESGNEKFLIDGFPRNDENRAAFAAVVSFLSHLFPLLSTCSNFIFLYYVVSTLFNGMFKLLSLSYSFVVKNYYFSRSLYLSHFLLCCRQV